MAALTSTCHCGKITITANRKPELINACQCGVCWRWGAEWAYYQLNEVSIPSDAKTKTYIWGEKKTAFYSCESCFGMMYWWPLDGRDGMGLNTRMVDPDELRRIEKRFTWMDDE